MKKMIIAALAAAGLGGCIAVPAPYYGGDAGYYGAPGPAVAVGVYAPPVYYGYGYRHRGHYRRW